MIARSFKSVVVLQAFLAMGITAPSRAVTPDEVRPKRTPDSAYQGPGHAGSALVPGADGLIEVGGGPFAAQNVTLLSWLSLTDFGPFVDSGNDCWGYVSPSGREYALVALANQMAVVEITDPINPSIIGAIPHPSCLWGDVKLYQNVAYVVTDVCGTAVGIQVVDLSDVDNGNVSLIRTISSPARNHNVAVNADSGYLYTCGSSGAATTVIFDLTDPTNPVQAGTWIGAYEHDVQVISYTTGPWAGREIMLGASQWLGLDVVDVTDKNNTFLISRTQYPGVQYCHQVWTEDLHYIYVDDELDSIPRTSVMDISDLQNPVWLGDFTSGTNAIDHNLYLRTGIIYEANYHSGLRVFDANVDPVSPPQVAWFDTYPPDDNGGFDGAWSVYPFFPSGTVIVSDIDRGLFVLSVDLNALLFSYPGGTPDTVSPDTTTPLTVHVEPVGMPVNPTTVTLHARIDGGPESAVTMVDQGGGDFAAALPAAGCLSVITYYVSAENTLGTLFVDPPGAPANAYSADVLSGLDVRFGDEFETDQGWTVGAPGDDAITGIWERVDPNGTAAQPADDHTADPGTVCFVTGQGSVGGSLGENDVDAGTTTLLSPTLDASDPDARIAYWRWYSNDTGAGPNADVFVIDISNDNGATWTNVETIGPSGAGTSGGWMQHEFVVADFVTPTAQVRMRFVASDLGAASIVEAAIDDFDVFVPVCGPGPTVPTLSDWGLLVLTLLMLTGGTVVFRRRARTHTPHHPGTRTTPTP